MFENALKDIKNTHKLNINIENEFDFELLESLLPAGLLSKRTFTKDIKNLIQNLSFVYNIDVEPMKNLIINSVNEKHNIDKTLLRKNARNYYLHKITKEITDNNDIIVTEKLQTKNMLQNKKLSKIL